VKRLFKRFWGPDVDADVDAELQFHLEMRARDFERRGLPPDDAQRAARERFGDVDRIGGVLRAHDYRRERQTQRREYMSDLTQDLRFGMRSLRRAPGFTAVAVLTLALGIGATTAIYSVVNGVVLRPLPYPDPDRITMVWMDNQRMGMSEDIHSAANLADYRAQNQVFEAIAAYSPRGYNVTGGCPEATCEPQRIMSAAASAELFPVLGVRPLLGRVFTAEEEVQGRDAVVVIGYGLWARQFGLRPDAVGSTLQLNGRSYTILGVMPRDFAYPSRETELWMPLALSPEDRTSRNGFWLWAVGRLKPGVPLERAQADMAEINRRMQEQFPSLRDYGVKLVPLPRQVVGPSLRTALWVMLGAVAAVLLIACANVANLMLSRAAVREREVGVRLALGASRTRLVRQLLTESVLLSLVGGALGVALAWGGLRLLTGLAPSDVPRLDQVRIDAPALVVTLGVAVLTGVLFGLVPALQASSPNLAGSLRDAGGRGATGGQRGNQLRRLLAAAQVALVVVLLTGAGLLIRSFLQLQQVDLGFRPDNLLTMRVALPGAKYPPPQRVPFYDALVERLRAVPGVQGVGAISDIFLSKTPNSTTFTIEGRPRTRDLENTEIPFDAVTPDYFRAMGIALVRGRTFTADDGRDSTPLVVIINEAMAKRFWPGENPVGRRFKYGGENSRGPWVTIVGVVGDMRRTGVDSPVRYETFLPLRSQPSSQMTFVVRTAGDPLASAPALRAAVRAGDPSLPVYDVKSMDQLLSNQVAQRRFSMALLGTFAGLALVLGLVGVYGVTSYLVAQRTREVGLRLALGAQPRTVVRMVVRQGMVVAALGVAAGLIGSVALTRLMAGLLYQVSPTDVVTLGVVTATLAGATLLANYIPARRAARVDPLVALRNE